MIMAKAWRCGGLYVVTMPCKLPGILPAAFADYPIHYLAHSGAFSTYGATYRQTFVNRCVPVVPFLPPTCRLLQPTMPLPHTAAFTCRLPAEDACAARDTDTLYDDALRITVLFPIPTPTTYLQRATGNTCPLRAATPLHHRRLPTAR